VYFSRLIAKGGFFCSIFPSRACILSVPADGQRNGRNMQKVIIWTD